MRFIQGLSSYLGVYLILALISSCSLAQDKTKVLDVKAFQTGIEKDTKETILDVRSPEEFQGGYIEGAINNNWNASDFKDKCKTLDKVNPVYVYCLSGSRSHKAAEYLRKNGYAKVYELDGGLLKWRAENYKEIVLVKADGMSIDDFNQQIAGTENVLIDFYAEWCAPCKKMKPDIEAIELLQPSKLKVIRINIDKNKLISKHLGIDALPVLQLYKNNVLVWTGVGYKDKETILKNIKEHCPTLLP